MADCKNCEYGLTLFVQKRDRETKIMQYIPSGRAECSCADKYGKRKFIIKDRRSECAYFRQRERK